MNQMVEYKEQRALSAADMRAQVNLVQEVMRAVMKKDTHYGVIPGTQKPSLYKAGAEVLCATFRIADRYEVQDLTVDGMARFRVKCIGVHQTSGVTLGEGLGECSSGEEKYKWRNAICPEEFDITPENMRRVKFKKWQGKVDKTQQVRTEPADQANTILKMACKRAKIAMTLNVTAASDIFTQDIEDLPEELRHDDEGVPAGDPALMARWVADATAAATEEALKIVWTDGMKAIKAAKDMPAYHAFKAAVEARGKALKQPPKPPGEIDADFVREMDEAQP